MHLTDDCVSIEEDWLREAIARYEEVDDVFRKEFLSGVMFTASSSKIDITNGATKMLHAVGASWIGIIDTSTSSNPPQGPYYVLGKELHEIWQLHDDSQGAFLTSLVSGSNK